ncbi:TPA: hypothetical protein ACH3X1_012440 [Trebouxia sp. C0004]
MDTALGTVTRQGMFPVQAGYIRCPACTAPVRSSQCLVGKLRSTYGVQASPKSDLSAIIIGSGFAGLSAAARLSQDFAQVTLLDRDHFTDAVTEEKSDDPELWRQHYEAETRRRLGVTQYKQPHVLLQKGLELIEEIFPGYKQELAQAGAQDIDLLSDMILYDWDKEWLPGQSCGTRSLAASRHLYETVLRKFVLRVSNLKVQTSAAVNGLAYNAEEQRVTGVHLKSGQMLDADLVVDASGKHSDISKWLEQLGHKPPSTMTVEAGLQYTYRMYEMPEDPERKWSIAVCMDNPEYNRTAVMVPIETNKWQLNLSGYKGYHCPLDEEGFLQFAKDLPSPTIYKAIRHAKPVSDISAYRNTGNFRRLFEKAPPPNGLCVIGDAVCCFNPINGQGMTVGLMGSQLLAKCIGEQLEGTAGSERQHQLAALTGLPAKFHSQLGNLVDYPWTVSVGPDAQKPNAVMNMPQTEANAFSVLLTKYFVALQQARFDDLYLMTKVTQVAHMLASPAVLFGPDVVGLLMWSVLRGKLKFGPSKENTRGTTAVGSAAAATATSNGFRG